MKRRYAAGLFTVLTLILAFPSTVQAACDSQAYARTVSLAKRGDVPAMLRLARHFGKGDCVAASKRWEANWYERAAARSDAGALAWLLKEADAMNPAALHNLGLMYRKGIVFKRDYAKALARYRQAAALKYPLSLHWVGMMHMRGLGVPKNNLQAARWFLSAARFGWADSQQRLCILYKDGRGIKKNPQMAFHFCTQAAEKKQAAAMVQLAEFYRTGFGVKKDPRKAHDLSESAFRAEKNAQTITLIADYERIGVSRKPNWSRSTSFYSMLGKSNAHGLFQKAEMYQQGGYKLRQDKSRARLLYERAAKLGHTGARIALAARYPSKTRPARKSTASKKDECKNAKDYFACKNKKNQEMIKALEDGIKESAKSPLSIDEQMQKYRAEKRTKQK